MAPLTKIEKQFRALLLARGLKQCPRCDAIKSITAFACNKYASDGLQSYCRHCYSAMYHADRDRRLAWQKRYGLEHREAVRRRNHAYYLLHRDELLRRQHDHYQEHVNDRQRYNQQYASSEKGQRARQVAMHRRKMRELGLPSDLTSDQWAYALQFFDHCCAYCGRQLKQLQQEHFIPVTLGGGLTVANIVPACAKCNQSKKTKLPQAWAQDADGVLDGALMRIEQYFELVGETAL